MEQRSSLRLSTLASVLSVLLFCDALVAQVDEASTGVSSISGTITLVDERGDEIEDRSNIVVFVDGIEPELYQGADVAVISQRGQRFSPRVLPIVQGATVEFPNDDIIFHNVFSLSLAQPFDLGIYPKGESRTVSFNQPGLVRVYCNIHPDMASTILVLNNQFFDTTGPDGRFEIDNVPAGVVTLRVWSEYGEEVVRQVSLDGGGAIELEFAVRETRRVTEHNNKFGRPYPEKY